MARKRPANDTYIGRHTLRILFTAVSYRARNVSWTENLRQQQRPCPSSARATWKLYYAAVIASANFELFILIKLRTVCVFASSSSPLCAKFGRPILLTTYSGNGLFFLSATTNLLLRSHISHIKVFYSAPRTHTHTQPTPMQITWKCPQLKTLPENKADEQLKAPCTCSSCARRTRERNSSGRRKKIAFVAGPTGTL